MITSVHNPKIKQIRALLTRRKDRQEAGVFVLEGIRLVEDAVRAGWSPLLAVYSSPLTARGEKLIEQMRQGGVQIEEAEAAVMRSLSDTETPQGLLAIVPRRKLPLPLELDFLLIADNLRDPGNLGAILRSAAAAGVQAVLLPPGTVDAFSPKVVRSAMGAHFHLPILELDWKEIQSLLKGKGSVQPIRILAAESDHGQAIWQEDLRQPVALLVGSEAEGPSPQGLSLADQVVHIPMPGQSESMNAAAAAAILLFEVVRQRSIVPAGRIANRTVDSMKHTPPGNR
jgi:TrmH family RNA methyltransferase